MSNYSKKAELLLKTLSDEEKEAIDINYPIKARRNKIVHSLRSMGVEISVINEISGIPGTTISRIGREFVPNVENCQKATLEDIKDILISIEKSVLKIANNKF